MWEYAPAPESRDIANLKPNYKMFVDGKFVEGSGEPLKTINPATEEVLAEVSTASSVRCGHRGQGRAPRLRPRVVEDAGIGARQVHLPDRAPDPGARA